MNTFSAFRFAARTLLRPQSARFQCLNPIALHPRLHARFQSRKSKVDVGRPRNDKIPYVQVSLVDENNSLIHQVSLANLLKSIDHKKEWVELVAEKPHPVVKIINKKATLDYLKKAKAKRRETVRKNILKEVQLTWGSEQSDLEHKLARVRSYLEIGARVDIVFSTKPKAVPPPPAVMRKKLQDTIEMMADVSTEFKPVEWRRNLASIHLKGIVDANRKLTPEQVKLVAEAEAAGETEGDEPAKADEPAQENTPAAESEAKAEATKLPSPPPQLSPQPALTPGKPKNFIDLSEFGFVPPPQRKNPLSAKKAVKSYGSRSPSR